MHIKILGGGCAKCQTTYRLFEELIGEQGLTAELSKIDDLQIIMAYDVMSTPGVVVNEKVVHRGRVPSRGQAESWLLEGSMLGESRNTKTTI